MKTYHSNTTGSLFPLYINGVLQLLMLMFCCRSSCAAYIMKYILAWDGDHMAQHFTQVSLIIIAISKLLILKHQLLHDMQYFRLYRMK
jgi:hypothetical protein